MAATRSGPQLLWGRVAVWGASLALWLATPVRCCDARHEAQQLWFSVIQLLSGAARSYPSGFSRTFRFLPHLSVTLFLCR